MIDSKRHLVEVLHQAQAQGLLPADAAVEAQESRPWPVVLLTAIGAWFAAIPLIGMVGALLGDLALRGPGPYLIGALLLAAAAVVLRARDVPIFVEQLAVPALLAGGGTLSMGLLRDLHGQPAFAVLCLLALAFAAVIRRAWMRMLLGAVAAWLATLVLLPHRMSLGTGAFEMWVPLHLVLLAGLGAWLLQAGALAQARGAALAGALEPIAAGWIAGALWGLAWSSGITFLAAGVAGGGVSAELARIVFGRSGSDLLMRGGSVLFAVAAAAVLVRAWPSLRQPAAAAVALVLAALSWFMPALGGALLGLAAAASTRRWLLAGLAGFVAVWVVGAFYYQLDWPLATKALVLAGAGAALAGVAWLAQPRRAPLLATRYRLADLHPPLWIATAAVATLAFANYGIWEKERLIARGDKVFVALAPVDPRSLVQGDFMRLAFRVPEAAPATSALAGRRPFVVARRDARGVAELLRVGRPGEPLAPGEFRIELTPSAGRWTLVSDAWFFAEGEAPRWQAAKFAEFRVDPSGHALLVGLADEQLRPIRSTP